jgi:hypothetical protein
VAWDAYFAQNGAVRLTLLLAALLALAFAAPAHAIVPPRDCGRISVKGKRYNIKADQMRCADAVRMSRRYLASSRRRPRGYRCRRNNPRETRIVFSCRRGTRNFFAIRR